MMSKDDELAKQLADLGFLRAEHERVVVENAQLRADVKETQASLAMALEWHKTDLKVALSAGAEMARLRAALVKIYRRADIEANEPIVEICETALTTSADASPDKITIDRPGTHVIGGTRKPNTWTELTFDTERFERKED